MKTLKPHVKAIKTVIFDLDGTLIDTEPAAVAAVRQCCEAWGIKVRDEDAGLVTGRTWAVAFDLLYERYKVPIGREEALQMIIGHYRAALRTNLVLVPGSQAAVRALSDKCVLGLVSGSNRTEIIWALGALGISDLFGVILGAEDYKRSKPAPDGYLKALTLMNADAQSTLVFEDSQAGIESARKAGLWVVAISSTNHFNQDLSQAHLVISDLREVNWDWLTSVAARLL